MCDNLRFGNPVRWILFWMAATVAAFGAAETPAIERDTLVYKDGDRLHGTLVKREAGEIVFRSDRFGEVRVKSADAVVIRGVKEAAKAPVAAAKQTADRPPAKAAPAPKSPPATPVAKAEAKAAEEKAEAARDAAEEERATIWDRFSPSVLTAQVREYFGPWSGRLTFSTEAVTDVAERNTNSVEARMSRKWTKDEVQVTVRYDYAETNEVPTTDITRANGSWRRQFTKTWFAHYRPGAEWNRASRRLGVPNDYVLVQQELGAGVTVYTTPTRTLRAGVSQNLFDIWTSAPEPEHTSRGVQSVFEEVELKLPWRMGLTQRGVFYPVSGAENGWENRIELNKKLTETLSTAVRHEIRRNNPDGSAQDYTRFRVMFGLDF